MNLLPIFDRGYNLIRDDDDADARHHRHGAARRRDDPLSRRNSITTPRPEHRPAEQVVERGRQRQQQDEAEVMSRDSSRPGSVKDDGGSASAASGSGSGSGSSSGSSRSGPALLIAKTTTMSVISEEPGDVFEAPPGSVLLHSCNCLGVWGSGIAARFKGLYPAAFRIYRDHCTRDKNLPSQLLGTCLLIPPQVADVAAGRQHYVACLLTSVRTGSRKDSAERVLEATRTAAADLIAQVEEAQEAGMCVGEVYACRYNSGHFAVRWERTRAVLEKVGMGMVVVDRPGPAELQRGEEEEKRRYSYVPPEYVGILNPI
ncbi:MAG: ADP-ribose 1''-phosphate phosphatase [Thelocarpon impressellum]|nr:MAG: ADP-ribose 1''-phosphate phosphatase [Thelocarpon impressellum]